MCANHGSKKLSIPLLYLIAITLGTFAGFSNFLLFQQFGLFISDIFIKIFKCISLPIIALSIIVTLSSYKTEKKFKTIWKRTLTYTFGTTIVAASLACFLYLLISPQNISGITPAAEGIQVASAKQNYLTYLLDVVPTNIFSPFINHHVMGALLVSIVLGLSIRNIPDDDSRMAVSKVFKGLHSLFIVITSWVVKAIPLALFGFITSTILELRNGVDISGLGGYLSIVVLANLIQGLVILPLFLYMNKIKPYRAMKAMMPALSVAFFSKSSAGTLPVTIDTIEKRLGVSKHISQLILPLCTSINMNGCAAFIFTTVIYLMQNSGASITLGDMFAWIVISTIAAIGNAGVPMGCFFLSASLLTSMNVPITLLGLILPFYNLIDMLETALNVWSDCCIAKVIDEKHKHLD